MSGSTTRLQLDLLRAIMNTPVSYGYMTSTQTAASAILVVMEDAKRSQAISPAADWLVSR